MVEALESILALFAGALVFYLGLCLGARIGAQGADALLPKKQLPPVRHDETRRTRSQS
jgi:hypothetical protein